MRFFPDVGFFFSKNFLYDWCEKFFYPFAYHNINFLKSFLIKPHISKVRCGESLKADYYYSTEICYDSFEYLRVLRFAESLHAFCSFWQMSLFEHCLHQLDE